MKLGIMQPYFFPYLGYYDLINRSDRWIVFDVVKYVPKSWMSRNRILHPTQGWQYITVPVDRHREGGVIKDVVLVDKEGSRRRILGQIEHYRHGRAPYFEPVRQIVNRCFEETPSDKLCDLDVKSLELVCEYLGVSFTPVALSRSGLVLPPIEGPGQWALEISAALGAKEYINPPGGRELFDPRAFEERQIKLTLTDLVDYRYPCGKYEFVERLSIVDVLMWNPPGSIKSYLDSLINSG